MTKPVVKNEDALVEEIVKHRLGPNDPTYHERLANVALCRDLVRDALRHGYMHGIRKQVKKAGKKS